MNARFPVIHLLLVISVLLAAGCTQPSPAPATTPAQSAPDLTPDLTAPAQAPETSLAIREFVDRAAGFARQQGKDTALAAFSNRSGPFVTGDVYVYALDYNGTALALPFQPDQVGTSFLGRTDGSGKAYTDIEIQLAKNGGGYLLYRYPHPGDNTPDRLKISYVEPVDETFWIGAGIYTSEERLIDPDLRQFIAGAKTFALEKGQKAAAAEFNNINGSFIQDDLYIFAYDYNGTVLAWPYRPDQIGVNRYNATDPVGMHHVQSMIAAAENGSGMVDYYSVNPQTNRTDLKISYITDVDGNWFIGSGRYIEPGVAMLNG